MITEWRVKVHLNKKLARLKFIKKEKKKTKINIIRLKETTQDFQLELRNHFECLQVEEAGIDESERDQLISDTIMAVAADIAPQGEKVKQANEEDKVIETLDRKRKELREIQDKTKFQKIEHVEYAELVKTVRKKMRQRSRKRKREQIESILNLKWKRSTTCQ